MNALRRVLALLFLMFLPVPFCFSQNKMSDQKDKNITLFLSGDVMLGRGIDQAFQKSVTPTLYESYVKDARTYIQLAERENGEIELPVSYNYIWGDALKVWKELQPDLKLINLETSITINDDPWEGKGIHYRMHPENIKALTTAGINHCSLANNHIMDWGRPGLEETLKTLQNEGIKYSGAGQNQDLAKMPSILQAGSERVLVFSYGARSSGIPSSWAAEKNRSGLNYIEKIDVELISGIKENIRSHKKQDDIVIFSIHWGGNWGYDIPKSHKKFAHMLIDEAGVDLIFGHSSHHPLGIEVYKNKLIVYGAGDFLNDYEGISGMEQFRAELSLMYFPEIESGTGNLKSLKMVPMEIKKFRLHKARNKDIQWLKKVLDREGRELGTQVILEKDKSFSLKW